MALEYTMSKLTRYVLQRFVHNKESIWQLISDDEEFRSICKDYGKCMEARQYWSRFEDADSKAKIAEYDYLLNQLEGEIHQRLEAVGHEPE